MDKSMEQDKDKYKELSKRASELLADSYSVPLYQRGFAWEDEQIETLLSDICYAMERRDERYFVGTIVVIKRSYDGQSVYELIDGQQRLTILTLINSVLHFAEGRSRLSYRSRPEMQRYLESLPTEAKQAEPSEPEDPSARRLHEARQSIQAWLEQKFGSGTDKEREAAEQALRAYLQQSIVLIRAEMPSDTDVAAYFEVMNNRGEQLHKHEILKAKLMAQLQTLQQAKPSGAKQVITQAEFAQIWDACSQMDTPIQRLFEAEDRRRYFGEDYNGFVFVLRSDSAEGGAEQALTIGAIIERMQHLGELSQGTADRSNSPNASKDEEDNKQSYYAIIDFPNFLMHVLRIYATKYLGEGAKDLVPLNERELLECYHRLKEGIDPERFLELLFRCRVLFDRYIVRTNSRDQQADDDIDNDWFLVRPKRYDRSWQYVNTFGQEAGAEGHQERLVKLLSMLQVSFRTRINKNWLQQALLWLIEQSDVATIPPRDYIRVLEQIALDSHRDWEKAEGAKALRAQEQGKPASDCYRMGVGTRHFLFNFIDYLCWLASRQGQLGEYISLKDFELQDFRFRYWNSVEHHLARNKAKEVEESELNSLGNLCLISRSANSKLSDRIVKEKVEHYSGKNLGPKRQIMYASTKASAYEWSSAEIEQHHREILSLLAGAEQILGLG